MENMRLYGGGTGSFAVCGIFQKFS